MAAGHGVFLATPFPSRIHGRERLERLRKTKKDKKQFIRSEARRKVLGKVGAALGSDVATRAEALLRGGNSRRRHAEQESGDGVGAARGFKGKRWPIVVTHRTMKWEV